MPSLHHSFGQMSEQSGAERQMPVIPDSARKRVRAATPSPSHEHPVLAGLQLRNVFMPQNPVKRGEWGATIVDSK
jgi:hypothetical protein